MLFGKGCHLPLGKPEIRSHIHRLHHRILDKIVQCRLRLVFLDGQDARHVDPGKNSGSVLALEHPAQPADVSIHRHCTRGILAANGVPLIDNEDKRLLFDFNHTKKIVHQPVTRFYRNIRIGLGNISQNSVIHSVHYVVIMRVGYETCQVKIDDGILVQVLFKRGVGGYLKVGKQAARVARLVVIGAQHLGRHRLAETTAARHAAKSSLREKCAVDNGNQARLVNIFAVPYALESSIADVDICAHDFLFLPQS